MTLENNKSLKNLFKQAVGFQLKNDLNNALLLYENIIKRYPLHTGALNNMGVIYLARGENDRAKQVLDKALSINPSYPDALNNLATALKNLGDYQAAVAVLIKALSLKPDFKSAYFNLGNTYREMDDYEAARDAFRQAITLDPTDQEALSNLGSVLFTLGRNQDAKQILQQSIQINPEHAMSHYHLGRILFSEGKLDAALLSFQSALSVNPDFSDAFLYIGNILSKQERLTDAISYYKKAVVADPLSSNAYYNLVLAYETTGDLDNALETQREALERLPNSVQSLVSGARLFMKIADWKTVDPILNRLLRHNFLESENSLLSDALILFHSVPKPGDAIYVRHRLWGDHAGREAKRLSKSLGFQFNRLLNRTHRIRIGYVSPDFRRHSVGWFFKQIIADHDPNRFETYCYATSSREDDVTQAIKRAATVFRRVDRLCTQDLARTIYDDQIGILVDLAGHTQGSRLDAFALRPAPVQVTAIGYPNGTGLATMDYRITDHHAETSDSIDQYREKPVLLSCCFLPLGPLDSSEIDLKKTDVHIPEDATLLVSFNRAEKLRPEVLLLWSRILTRCPKTVLGLGCGYFGREDLRANILSNFSSIDHQRRVYFFDRARSEESHRARYRIADLALDTFPYSGTTTSYEALWMNTPVITLLGAHHVQRTTYSILKHLGIIDTVAYSETEYVQKAVYLIEHPAALKDIKTRLSKILQDETKTHPRAYVEKLEAAYQTMWRRFQEGSSPKPISI